MSKLPEKSCAHAITFLRKALILSKAINRDKACRGVVLLSFDGRRPSVAMHVPGLLISSPPKKLGNQRFVLIAEREILSQ